MRVIELYRNFGNSEIHIKILKNMKYSEKNFYQLLTIAIAAREKQLILRS